ncbi:SPOR domain-containing protein [Clostridiaceae bacterium 35-E11]
MRQSRIKSRKEYKGQKIGIIILFTILLPVISIGIGYLGAKHLILPNLFSKEIITEELNTSTNVEDVEVEIHKEEESPESAEETRQEDYINTFEIKGLDIFGIQVGSFSTKENAQSLIKELNRKGMGGYIWYDDKYKVITAAMLERESIDILITEVKQEYAEAFIVTQNVPTRAVKYGKEDAKYVSLLEKQNIKLIEIFQGLSKNIRQMKEEENSAKDALISIKGYQESLKKMKDELNAMPSNPNIQEIRNAFIKIIDDMNVGLTYDANLDAVEKIAKTQNTFLVGLYQYSNFAMRNEY